MSQIAQILDEAKPPSKGCTRKVWRQYFGNQFTLKIIVQDTLTPRPKKKTAISLPWRGYISIPLKGAENLESFRHQSWKAITHLRNLQVVWGYWIFESSQRQFLKWIVANMVIHVDVRKNWKNMVGRHITTSNVIKCHQIFTHLPSWKPVDGPQQTRLSLYSTQRGKEMK